LCVVFKKRLLGVRVFRGRSFKNPWVRCLFGPVHSLGPTRLFFGGYSSPPVAGHCALRMGTRRVGGGVSATGFSRSQSCCNFVDCDRSAKGGCKQTCPHKISICAVALTSINYDKSATLSHEGEKRAEMPPLSASEIEHNTGSGGRTINQTSFPNRRECAVSLWYGLCPMLHEAAPWNRVWKTDTKSLIPLIRVGPHR